MVSFNVKMTNDLMQELRRVKNKDRYIMQALREKFLKDQRKKTLKNLAKEYKQAAEEDRKVNAEWEATTLEGWD